MKNEELYTHFALVREMMETPEILRNFKLKNADTVIVCPIKTSAGRYVFVYKPLKSVV